MDDPEKELTRPSSDNEPLSLLAFKIMDDPFVGTITFCRIYSGMLNAGDALLNSTRDKKERVGPHAADARQQPRRHQGSLSPATSSRSRA